MEKEIVKLGKDVEHVKETTEEIKASVLTLVARAEENHVDIVALRGRLREVEHEVKDLKSNLETVRSLIWKLFGTIAVGGGSAIGVIEMLGK